MGYRSMGCFGLSFENDRLPILKGFADGIQSGDSGLYFMAKDIAYATVDIGGPYTYNGSPIIIGMAVAFDGQTLEAGKDYSFSIVDAGGSSISDIVDAGTYHVMLAGLNDFTGTKDVPFNIVAKDLPTEDNITVVDGPFTYNGTAHEPEVTVTDGDKTLAKNVDFTVSYEENIAAGTATVIVTGTGNYQGIRKVPFTIGKRPVTVKADDKTMISGDKLPTFTYTVEEQLPGENALDGIPVLTCETDGRITGQYPIKVDLTAVSYTSNYTAANPGFINGTLTVYPTPFIPPAGSYDSSDESKNVPEETPKAETTVSGNIMTGVTTKKAVINSKGNATAVFGWAQATDVINKAAEEAGKQGEGYTARVEFRVEAPDNVATVETILPKDAVSQALKYGISALTISTPIASITFDADTLSTLSEEAAGQIKVTASRVETSSLSPEVQQQIGDRPVFDFSVTSGNKVISQFGGNVTVSVPYTPKEGEDTNAIVIYYINAEGELEIVKNCVYDPETGTIRFATNHFSMYAVGYNKVDFKDVPVTAWYGNAVTFIAARGITAGTGGGNFSPEAKLTRGQFIVMLMRAYEIDPDTNITDNFADAGDIWYTGYLAAAKRLGISNGIGNNMFGPDREITRQEVFTLLYNTLRILGKLPGSSSGKSLSSFSDVEDIASWAKEAISYLVETGIINGSGGKLLPTETSTRAQMTQVLYNLMNQ